MAALMFCKHKLSGDDKDSQCVLKAPSFDDLKLTEVASPKSL